MNLVRPILVTGVAGFIGFHVAQRLMAMGCLVIGVDNLNEYYDVELKKFRLQLLESHKNFKFVKLSIENRDDMNSFFEKEMFQSVVHLAAQAGVRYSLVNPYAYIDSNVSGFINILEGCRHSKIRHLVYASSSSVYGANQKMPFSVHDTVDQPLSLYAATKKATELMAYSYSHLYQLPTTGLRFFTVYGPWGRPDMALFLFTKAILEGKPIQLFNGGHMQRDFTYIDDIVDGIIAVLARIPTGKSSWCQQRFEIASSENPPYQLYNIGSHHPVDLLYFIETLEKALGKKAKKVILPMQAGDVPATYADIKDLSADAGFEPKTSIEDGIKKFVEWYLSYYRKKIS